jgi:hypothetical protein
VTNIVVLNSEAHRDLRVDPRPSARGGDNERFVQVVSREFPLLVVHYPILFSKDADTGAFYCGAMLGFDAGENLFLNDRGEDAYRPLNLRRLPFFAAGPNLAIDLDSPRVGAAKGELLFAENGAQSPYLESVSAIFRELKPGLEATEEFIKALLALQLIEPIDISVGFDDGAVRDLRGLYTVNRNVLRGLPDETIVDLFRRGYLHLMSLMIASLKQVPALAQKKNRRLLQGSEALSGALAGSP